MDNAKLAKALMEIDRASGEMISGLMMDHPFFAVTINDWPPLVKLRRVRADTAVILKSLAAAEDQGREAGQP